MPPEEKTPREIARDLLRKAADHKLAYADLEAVKAVRDDLEREVERILGRIAGYQAMAGVGATLLDAAFDRPRLPTPEPEARRNGPHVEDDYLWYRTGDSDQCYYRRPDLGRWACITHDISDGYYGDGDTWSVKTWHLPDEDAYVMAAEQVRTRTFDSREQAEASAMAWIRGEDAEPTPRPEEPDA